jgi:hypothetical protein
VTLPATETFTASDGTQVNALSNWSTVTNYDLDINSNGACADRAGAEQCDRWNADTFEPDQYAEATWIETSAQSGLEVGVAVRCSDTAETYYGFYGNSGAGNSYLFKVVNGGSWTQIGAARSGFQNGDRIRLEVEGTSLRCYINDVQEGATETDSDISSGYPGICGYDDGTVRRLDDWEGGNLAGKDTYLKASTPTANYGSDDGIRIDTGSGHVGLLEFDLSSIPADAACVSATLYLYVQTGGSSTDTIYVHELLSANADWTEAAATWNTKDGASPWAGSAGCGTSGTDYDATALGSATFPGSNPPVGTEIAISLTPAAVQDWFGDSNQNYGIRLHMGTFERYLCSSDHATPGYRPQLVVDYTPATGGQPMQLRGQAVPGLRPWARAGRLA